MIHDESMRVDDDRRSVLKGVLKKGTGRFLEDKDNGIIRINVQLVLMVQPIDGKLTSCNIHILSILLHYRKISEIATCMYMFSGRKSRSKGYFKLFLFDLVLFRFL